MSKRKIESEFDIFEILCRDCFLEIVTFLPTKELIVCLRLSKYVNWMINDEVFFNRIKAKHPKLMFLLDDSNNGKGKIVFNPYKVITSEMEKCMVRTSRWYLLNAWRVKFYPKELPKCCRICECFSNKCKRCCRCDYFYEIFKSLTQYSTFCYRHRKSHKNNSSFIDQSNKYLCDNCILEMKKNK